MEWSDRRVRALGVAVAAGALLGCGDLDTGEVESDIKEKLGPKNGVIVESVRCPDDRDLDTGDRFTCRARLAGGISSTVVIRQNDDSGNYEARFKPGTLPVDARALADELKRRTSEQGDLLRGISCPEGKRQRAGGVVHCNAVDDDGGRRTIRVTFTDDAGSFRYAVVD